MQSVLERFYARFYQNLEEDLPLRGCNGVCNPESTVTCLKQDHKLIGFVHSGYEWEPEDKKFLSNAIGNIVKDPQLDQTLILRFIMRTAYGPCVCLLGPLLCSGWSYDKYEWQERREASTSTSVEARRAETELEQTTKVPTIAAVPVATLADSAQVGVEV